MYCILYFLSLQEWQLRYNYFKVAYYSLWKIANYTNDKDISDYALFSVTYYLESTSVLYILYVI